MSKASANGSRQTSRVSLLEPFSDSHAQPDRKQILSYSFLVFAITVVVRLVAWYYGRAEALKVQTTVTVNYKKFARFFLQEGFVAFYSPHALMSDVDLLGHPPGYPLLLASIYKIFGESDAVIQFLQITAEGVAAVLLMLIGMELLSRGVGIISGLLAALSPQFSWNSILILPDTISVLPILLGVYLLVHWRKRFRWHHGLLIGICFGLSALLRANNMLLAPFVSVLIILRVFPWRTPADALSTKARLVPAASLVAGTILVIAPVTIRNAIVYRHFVPLSLGAGQTLLEGIADYDEGQRFDIPQTDVEIAQQEAAETGRPDYATSLFGPDGINRERARLARGFSAIKSHPFWFATVMIQRSASMLKFERVPIISLDTEHKMVYPSALRLVQRLFLTSFMLPLMLGGVALLMINKKWEALTALLIVPAYYFLFQSALHTEYRYVIALNYFLLAFAAVAIAGVVRLILGKIGNR